MDLPTPPELNNLYDQLVLWRNHTHVQAVWVAGRLRVRAGVVLDVDRAALRARTRAAARRLWSLLPWMSGPWSARRASAVRSARS